MARVETIVVGGGIGAVGDLAVGALLTIATIDPPAVEVASRTGVPVATYSRSIHIVVGNNIAYSGTFTNGSTTVGSGIILTTAGAAVASRPVVIGNDTEVSSGGQVQQVVVIGGQISATSPTAINGLTLIGDGITYASVGGGVGIGDAVSISSQNCTAVGSGASIAGSSSNSTVVGQGAAATGQRNTVIGDAASAVGSDNTVIGQGASTSGTLARVVAINATVTHANNFAVFATSFAVNTMVVGNATFIIDTVCIGKGNTSATPNSVTWRQTNGVGTDIAAGNMILQAGLSTGNASPGAVVLQIGKAAAGSGTTLQTAYQALRVDSSTIAAFTILSAPAATDNCYVDIRTNSVSRAIMGVAGAAGQLTAGSAQFDLVIRSATNILFTADDGTTTHLRVDVPAAGQTALFVYDADNATLERVTVGAADSGGAGFKLLRIPN